MERPGGVRLRWPIAAMVMLVVGTVAAGRLEPTAQELLSPSDRDQLIRDLASLAHDSMEGRRAGSPGSERARRFLASALTSRSISDVRGVRLQAFPLVREARDATSSGTNVMGLVQGTAFPDRYIVVSAHYDHLGQRGDDIYNGADDNASGAAALLTLATVFARDPARHSLLFVAFDAEESGLLGARAFLADPPVPYESIELNVNLDMISRNTERELYAAGSYHYPLLAPFVEEVQARAPLSLLMGHDSPAQPGRDDWTMASDHGPFHEAGIPFLYFGVEDHADYHRPTDTFENVTLDFYVDAVETVVDFLRVVDRAWPAL